MSSPLQDFLSVDLNSKRECLNAIECIRVGLNDDKLETIDMNFNVTEIHIHKVLNKVKLYTVLDANEEPVVMRIDELETILKHHLNSGIF